MNIHVFRFLYHVPFLNIEEIKVEGVVTEEKHHKNGGVDVTVQTQESEKLGLRFSKDDSLPSVGDTIEVTYQIISLPFFTSCNEVLVWGRSGSQTPSIHNMVPERTPTVWMGTISH